MVRAEVAWEAPYKLWKRLGHLDVAKLAQMQPSELTPFIAGQNGEGALHRFTSTMARLIVAASQRLIDEYNGSARNIWPARAPAEVVVRRLDDFEGISHKIAHMTVRLLVTYYGVPLNDWHAIDVAEDRHVARVFLRTGLVAGRGAQTHYRVSDLREQVVNVARQLSATYPGALDEPAFDVGRNWCRADQANCRQCPLRAACPKRRKHWQIVG